MPRQFHNGLAKILNFFLDHFYNSLGRPHILVYLEHAWELGGQVQHHRDFTRRRHMGQVASQSALESLKALQGTERKSFFGSAPLLQILQTAFPLPDPVCCDEVSTKCLVTSSEQYFQVMECGLLHSLRRPDCTLFAPTWHLPVRGQLFKGNELLALKHWVQRLEQLFSLIITTAHGEA